MLGIYIHQLKTDSVSRAFYITNVFKRKTKQEVSIYIVRIIIYAIVTLFEIQKI